MNKSLNILKYNIICYSPHAIFRNFSLDTLILMQSLLRLIILEEEELKMEKSRV
jgi:hypothetical protein